jgi:hypothetical protein
MRNKGGQAIEVFKDLSEPPGTDTKEIQANKATITLKVLHECLVK